jgi:hypothetical protein
LLLLYFITKIGESLFDFSISRKFYHHYRQSQKRPDETEEVVADHPNDQGHERTTLGKG